MIATLGIADADLRKLVVHDLELISAAEFDTCTRLARRLRVPLEQVIAEQGRLPLGFVLEQVAASWGVRYTELKVGDIEPAALRRIPEKTAATFRAAGFAITDDGLSVAMADPRDQKALAELRRIAGMAVVPFLTDAAAIQRAHLLYRDEVQTMLRRTRSDAAPSEG